jgi:hypothetical protein
MSLPRRAFPRVDGAGVQFKDAWIPASAGMTDRYYGSELNNV